MQRTGNLTHILNDALATEWMMTLEACQAMKRIYTDALMRKGEVGHLQPSDIAALWAQHEDEGISESMHMLRSEGSSMALQTEPMKGTNYTSVYKNVAVIDIIGPIVPRVRGMSSGSVGAQQIKNDFITAFEDDNIKAILFNVDSPGGDARGISELAQTIKKARDKNTKLIHAYASGWMASAAYFIVSPAHRIVVNDWASVGSIGVVIGVPPKMEGDYIEFVSTNAPEKRPDIDTESGKKVYQDKADYMGDLFAKQVAAYRGVTVEKVVSDFGRGGTLIGRQAVAGGLGDAVGTFDSALHALVSSKSPEGPVIENQPGDDPDNPFVDEDSKAKVQSRLDAATKSKLPDGDKTMSDEKKTLWQKIVAAISGDEKAEAEAIARLAVPDNGYIAGTAAELSQMKFASGSAPAEDSDEVKALRVKAAEFDALQAKVKEQQAAALEVEAEAFAGGLVTGNVIMPAKMEAFKAEYLQRAQDDAANPLATGSRVENLKAALAGLPKHNLTDEFMKSDVPTGAVVLNPNGSSTQEELLAADEAATIAWAKKHNPRPQPVN
jgi:capsid assembly protease